MNYALALFGGMIFGYAVAQLFVFLFMDPRKKVRK